MLQEFMKTLKKTDNKYKDTEPIMKLHAATKIMIMMFDGALFCSHINFIKKLLCCKTTNYVVVFYAFINSKNIHTQIIIIKHKSNRLFCCTWNSLVIREINALIMHQIIILILLIFLCCCMCNV